MQAVKPPSVVEAPEPMTIIKDGIALPVPDIHLPQPGDTIEVTTDVDLEVELANGIMGRLPANSGLYIKVVACKLVRWMPGINGNHFLVSINEREQDDLFVVAGNSPTHWVEAEI